MRIAIASALVLVLGPFGCPSEQDPQQTREVAESTPPAVSETPEQPPPATAEPQPPTSQRLTADPAQSKVGFAVAKATVGHVGHFEKFSATLELVDGQPRALEIVVKTGSVVTDARGLTSHLESADFFAVDQFPSATFSTESITAVAGDDPHGYVISGMMYLHGVSKRLEFPATIEIEPARVLGRATLEISAKAFGIDYEGMEAELAEDAVELEIVLSFPR